MILNGKLLVSRLKFATIIDMYIVRAHFQGGVERIIPEFLLTIGLYPKQSLVTIRNPHVTPMIVPPTRFLNSNQVDWPAH